jgi:hypothetical protein
MPCKRPCNSVGAGGGTEQGHGGDTAFGGVGLSRAGDNFSARGDRASSSLDIFSGYMRIEFLDPAGRFLRLPRSRFSTVPLKLHKPSQGMAGKDGNKQTGMGSKE